MSENVKDEFLYVSDDVDSPVTSDVSFDENAHDQNVSLDDLVVALLMSEGLEPAEFDVYDIDGEASQIA